MKQERKIELLDRTIRFRLTAGIYAGVILAAHLLIEKIGCRDVLPPNL